ncbi:hypothetical protein GB937_006211, partial [Aspergillus fischeri]
PFFSALGCTSAIVFTACSAAYGTAKAGVVVCSSGVLRPDLIVKNILPTVMAGILGIYGLVASVPIANTLSQRRLSTLVLLSWVQVSRFAIGIVGDAGVRGTSQQPRLYVGVILILFLLRSWQYTDTAAYNTLWQLLSGTLKFNPLHSPLHVVTIQLLQAYYTRMDLLFEGTGTHRWEPGLVMAKESSVPSQLSVSYMSNMASRVFPLFADCLVSVVVEGGELVVVDVGSLERMVVGVVVSVPLSDDAEGADDDDKAESLSLSLSTQSNQSSPQS